MVVVACLGVGGVGGEVGGKMWRVRCAGVYVWERCDAVLIELTNIIHR